MRTTCGHFTNRCRSFLGGSAPPIPNCLGRFSNKGFTTFSGFFFAAVTFPPFFGAILRQCSLLSSGNGERKTLTQTPPLLSLQGLVVLSAYLYISRVSLQSNPLRFVPFLDPPTTATMSDEGEKTCPLCAEVMDLTDQQLKPCKCGYEICVWCWHQIIDMAEKEETEGRCPACRTPYNKEKIVGTAANCERLVAEMNMERKVKSQKAKSKTSEGRKQLSSVRVIQRNLVYIVGLPLDLADEDLLQRKEYFGQYGKVLKVSISRTAAGAIQHFANNTCSVYITYSKEEEAIRCIQSVHGFVLDDNSLRACFGTTKYCHSWLRNVPCSNPDCLYLHEIGSQEDSFTKDEIISAYTRSRVQQITGATNNMQWRSGSMLPPPADEYCNNSSASSGKSISKSASNNPASSVRGSPPNSSSGRSVVLPAAASWGMRASNSQPPSASLACSNGPSKPKPDTCSGSIVFSTAVASAAHISTLDGDVGKKLIPNEESLTIQHKGRLESPETMKQDIGTNHRATASETPVTPGLSATSTMNSHLYGPPASEDKNVNMQPNITNSFDPSEQACKPGPEKDRTVSTDGKIQSLCSDMSSMSIDRHLGDELTGGIRPNSLSDHTLIKSPRNQGSPQYYTEQYREPLTLLAGKAVTSTNDLCVTRERCDWRSDPQTQVAQSDDMLSFDDQRLKDPEVVSRTSYLPYSSHSSHLSNHSRVYSPQHNEAYASIDFNVDPKIVNKKAGKGSLLHASGASILSNGYPVSAVSSPADLDRTVEDSYLLPNEGKGKHMGGFEGEAANVNHNAAVDMGESSIISNILSMDFDAWDDSLTSPQNLVRLMGETDKQHGSLKVSSSRKVQTSNQSRFSFARQEESKNQVFDVEPHLSNIGQVPKNHSFSHDFIGNRDSYFSSFNVEESDNFARSHSHLSSNKLSVSRAQISAPPGFSVPSRAPPPGFTSHERMEQAFDTMSGNHFLDNSSLLGTPYQAPPSGNIGSTGDIEFMDPAILAVGKGRLPGTLSNPGLDVRSNFPPQLSAFENEARLQLLMQRSLAPHQNLRFADMGDSFSSLSDSYGNPSRIMEQSPASNQSPFSQLSLQQSRNALMSNGHWDGWHEVQSGNDLGMAELLRNEKLGFNKFYTGYEDSKFRMPSSGNLYNRTFGI
uniref:CCR4-NOT transcription complex subunit 4 n=1 Tax=Davidia involucrata TaxID=16924 RepID=A0A5B6ZGY8_DAVIN